MKVTIKATGNVFHLEDLSEFEGIYFQAKAAMTIGKAGKTGIFLVNRRGVTIHLRSEEEKGFDLSLGRGGIKIKFKKRACHKRKACSNIISSFWGEIVQFYLRI